MVVLPNTTNETLGFNLTYLEQKINQMRLALFCPALPVLQIGEQFVGEDGRAESRSQTKLLREAEQESGSANTGRAPLKRAGTMDVTKAVNS